MTLKEMQDYYVGQRFVMQYDDPASGVEVFELTITDIDLEYDEDIQCKYRYLESPPAGCRSGEASYPRQELDDLIRNCWYQWDDWGFIGWLPIKPLNTLPEDLFVI
jgi:hypothetical protein